MGKTILVDKDIQDGRLLVEALDRSKFSLDGALWYYMLNSDEWRLLLVSSLVERTGPKKVYRIVQSTIEDMAPTFGVSLNRISVLSPKNKLIQLLSIALRTGRGLSGIRFTRNTINGVFIEDAYIYRLDVPRYPR